MCLNLLFLHLLTISLCGTSYLIFIHSVVRHYGTWLDSFGYSLSFFFVFLQNIGGPVYSMRHIDFLGRSTHIIYQDENGPCPLISICKWYWLSFDFNIIISSWLIFYPVFTSGNCLLLKGQINFEPHLIKVTMENLVHIV